MSRLILETSIEVDNDIKYMAHQLGIDTTDLGLMTNAVLKKALNLCKYIVHERKDGAKIFIERRFQRDEIRTI